MRRSFATLLLAGIGVTTAADPRAAAEPAPALRVRATEAMAPCLVAAAREFAGASGRAPSLETGDLSDPTADVLVGSSVEITRALESGRAQNDSDVEIASVPWVLVLGEKAPDLHSLKEVAAAGLEVELPVGPASYEARRALTAAAAGRVRESDASGLRKAGIALVPLSLAGPGRRIAVDVPALLAQAAVGARAASPEAARALVAFLGGESGRRAFASCAAASP
ncbi:MAG TPA: hypothetical protein VMV21_16365, partial [Vicinamibacteria bacterium]|nr:hypothetical protein [Vicinamibacteria bacterium]